MAPIIDCHVHSFMDWDRLRYTYPTGTIFHHPWTHTDYVKATSPSALQPSGGFVYMSLVGLPPEQHILQCELAQHEAERLAAVGSGPLMLGIVTSADVSQREGFGGFLDEVRAVAPLLCGVRPFPLPWDDPATIISAAREIQARGLAMDVLLAEQAQLSELYAIAAALPELPIVLNHFGFVKIPGGDLPDFEWWAAQITHLAALPNVMVKISGGQRADHSVDARSAVRPFAAHAIRCFGYERCIFNGNWFVVDAQDGFFSYRAWAQFVDELLGELRATEDERDWLLRRAGEHAYKVTACGRS
jgi:L-fuconolactonase|mmetsp:Transcript_23133/g.52511  ORF Transcript_23133/g.52511 Transcript_23133/m.52511 type:complete len:302 (-) Transcript_23133:183-1088(-)